MIRPLLLASVVGASLASLTTGCSYFEEYSFDVLRGRTSRETPVVPIRNMYDQDRYENQGESRFFEDHRMMRPHVQGTVAREMEVDPVVATGRLADDSGWALSVPEPVVARFADPGAFVRRGQERYNIYCTPCHSESGDGNGIVAKRGMPMPPSYHQDRLRHMPDGQLFATITNGIRNMPGYYAQTTPDDRWAIVAYVRALQLSQAPSTQPTPEMPQ